MNIAINAMAMRSLSHGVGNYIANLGLSLAKNFPEDRYTFFIRPDNTDLPLFLKDFPNVNFKVVRLPRPLRLVWEQLILPLEARSFDVLHSPVYVTPILKLTRYVLTELDMTVFIQPEKYSLVKRIYFQLMIPLSIQKADRILTISNSAARDIQRILKVPPVKIVTAKLGVREGLVRVKSPAELSRIREKYHLPKKFILFLGVLEPRKNISGLIKAFAKISGQFEEDLVVGGGVGLGWNTDEIFQLVKELGLSERVHFIGTVEESDKAGLYSSAEIFAYPSFYEGFGIPILEAMSCGVPVVTSQGSSLEEVAGEGALLVDPNDTAELSRALIKMVSDNAIRDRLIINGQQNVRRFSWSKTAEITHQAYHGKN